MDRGGRKQKFHCPFANLTNLQENKATETFSNEKGSDYAGSK